MDLVLVKFFEIEKENFKAIIVQNKNYSLKIDVC